MRPGGGEGQSGAGEPCGDTGAREGPRRPARGAPAARARAGRRQPRLAGRTRRRAAPRRVLRLESPPPSAARRVQPSSPAARAAAGGLSQHLPAVSHTPLRDPGGGFAHTRAPTAARSLRSQKSKIQNQEMRGRGERARLAEVRRLGSLLAAAGGTGAAGERGQVRQSVGRSPECAGSGGRTCIRRTRRPCGLGHDSAAGPSSHVESPGSGGRGALRTEETRNSGSGKATGGAGKSRAADAQPPREAGPLNNHQESSGWH